MHPILPFVLSLTYARYASAQRQGNLGHPNPFRLLHLPSKFIVFGNEAAGMIQRPLRLEEVSI